MLFFPENNHNLLYCKFVTADIQPLDSYNLIGSYVVSTRNRMLSAVSNGFSGSAGHDEAMSENGCCMAPAASAENEEKAKSVHGSSWFIVQIFNRALFVWFDKFVQWRSQSFTPFNFNWKLDDDFR